jgi:hypothetical protein
MDARRESEPTPMKNRTTVERKSERELVVTRTFNGPVIMSKLAGSKAWLWASARMNPAGVPSLSARAWAPQLAPRRATWNALPSAAS